MNKWVMICNVCLLSSALSAQIVDIGGIYQVATHDSLKVLIMPGYDVYGGHTYYYLPAHLRLSSRIDKTPEFNFMTYNTEPGTEISGAILHFLLLWGLTPDQEQEVEMILKTAIDSNAILAGSVSIDIPKEGPSFSITGNTELAQILRSRWSSEPISPVIPGTKMALSYNLNGKEARLFQEALSCPAKLDSIQAELKFEFNGGYRNLWYNRFKDNHYTLKTSLRQLFSPILETGKTKKR